MSDSTMLLCSLNIESSVCVSEPNELQGYCDAHKLRQVEIGESY